ncbi:hypothetical protein UlMin_028047 [Ulmus minor]
MERQIEEEYNQWRERYAPSSYDWSFNQGFSYRPSHTVEWLPGREENGDFAFQTLMFGNYTLRDHSNYLVFAKLKLPASANANISSLGCEIIKKIKHDGIVYRARFMSNENQKIIATKTSSSGLVCLFDSSKPSSEALVLTLKGHTKSGKALSWNKSINGYLLSGSLDAKVCLWDVNATPNNKTLEAYALYQDHNGPVRDVAWRNESSFGSVGVDKCLNIYDLRSPAASNPVQYVLAHKKESTCLAFNPFNGELVVTGSLDHTIKVFDLRQTRFEVHTLKHHRGRVNQLGWNPKYKGILASGCHSRMVLIWDLTRIGQILTREEEAEGPPELLFDHAGHKGQITDFAWNTSKDRIIASVAKDNSLQIWKMKDIVYKDKDDELEESTSTFLE